MRPCVFSGSDSIGTLSFSAKNKDARDHNGLLESIAVCCFQCYVKRQAELSLGSQLTGSAMAKDFKRSKMLLTYKNVVSFLLQTYATDEVIAQAYSDVFNFRPSSAMIEETCSWMLWDAALRCRTLLSNRRLKFSLHRQNTLPTAGRNPSAPFH